MGVLDSEKTWVSGTRWNKLTVRWVKSPGGLGSGSGAELVVLLGLTRARVIQGERGAVVQRQAGGEVGRPADAATGRRAVWGGGLLPWLEQPFPRPFEYGDSGHELACGPKNQRERKQQYNGTEHTRDDTRLKVPFKNRQAVKPAFSAGMPGRRVREKLLSNRHTTE